MHGSKANGEVVRLRRSLGSIHFNSRRFERSYRSYTNFCGTNSDGHQVFVVCLYGHTYTVWTNEQLDILFTECISRWRKTPADLLDWNTFEKLSQLIDEYRELQPVLYVTQFERGVQTLWTLYGAIHPSYSLDRVSPGYYPSINSPGLCDG